MEKQFVTYEIALKLKELGFDEPCLTYFHNDNENITDRTYHLFEYFSPIPITTQQLQSNKGMENCIAAPLWQQVIDWFIEKYSIYIDIFRGEFGWHYAIKRKNKDTIWANCLESFQSVREQSILKAITLISK
jgi:hypothetical protein